MAPGCRDREHGEHGERHETEIDDVATMVAGLGRDYFHLRKHERRNPCPPLISWFFSNFAPSDDEIGID